jgi:hypothetical protein
MVSHVDAAAFLARLGLGEDADGSAIRRAYARELKLLDLATQAKQFQELREAYEAAMQWAAPVSTGHIDAPMPAPVCHGDEADALAQQVFAEFLQACIGLRQPPQLTDQARWDAALLRYQLDSRLINPDAMRGFETRLAEYLADDWVSGNETLFLSALNVLEWHVDERRLLQLGEAGSVIARAIEQCSLFYRQDQAAFLASRNVLIGLRLSRRPMRMRLRGEMPYLESMLQFFPAYIAVTAGMRNVERWRALHAQLAVSTVMHAPTVISFDEEGRTVGRGEDDDERSVWLFELLRVVFMVLLVCSWLFSD